MSTQPTSAFDGSHHFHVTGGAGVISQLDFMQFWDVMQSAYAIHLDREAVRDGLWKEYPAEDQAGQVKVKIDRVLRSLEKLRQLDDVDFTIESLTDDEVVTLREQLKAGIISEGYDIINYANFFIRLVDGVVKPRAQGTA